MLTAAAAPKTPKRSRVSAVPTSSKAATRGSKGSRNSLISSSRATESPVISLTSNNSSRVAEEASLGKRKRRTTKYTPVDEDTTPVFKKQRVRGTSSASQPPSVKPVNGPEWVGNETIPEEEEDPVKAGNIPHSPSTSKSGIGSAVLRIGPPRKRKKIAPLPPATPPSPCVPNFGIRQPREEEESTQEAARRAPSNPSTVRKKRRLKPTSDVRPKLPVLAEKEPLASPSHSYNAGQEHAEPHDQEPFGATHPNHDNKLVKALPEPTPPRTSQPQIPPDPPVDDAFSTATPPHAMRNAKKLAPIPRLEPSHFKPYLKAADTTSVIDEYSPRKSFPTQDTIESSVRDSQVRLTVSQPPDENFEPALVDDVFDDDIAQKIQDVEDAYIDLDGQANGTGTPNEEQPTTVSNVDQYILTLFLLFNRRTLIQRNRSHPGPSRL